MKWTRIEVQTTVEAEDLISAFLDELGVQGVMIEDHVPLTEEEKKAMYVDILPEQVADDGKSRVSCFLDDSYDIEEIRTALYAELDRLREFIDVGSGQITVSITEDKDWMNNWKEFFKPFEVCEGIWVKPSWEELPAEAKGAKVVEIDPGVAFGTGTHETTKLCIGELTKYLKPGDTVFDVGAGSGILSIVSVLLGAGFVHGMDIDEVAVKAAVENGAMNRIPKKKLKFTCGNLLAGQPLLDNSYSLDAEAIAKKNTKKSDAGKAALKLNGGEPYDIVVANILADVIIPLSGVIRPYLKPGGYFITSGIVEQKENDVVSAMQAHGFQVVEVVRMGEWVSVVGK